MKTYDELQAENERLVAQVEALNSKNFELTCYRVDVLRCLKTIAFEHNHSDVSLYQPMARHLMDSISVNAELKEVRAEAGRDGYLQGYTDALNVQFSNLGQILADEYALLVKAGEV